MSFIEIFLIAISLAMDAFAVAISNGLMLTKIKFKHVIVFGIFFGGFQFIMPVIGYWGASNFQNIIVDYDHWIAFILLALIGANMIKESFSKKDDKGEHISESSIMSIKNMTLLAIATSIDALAVGVTIALAGDTNIWFAATIIGIVAFIFAAVGVMLGKTIGAKFQAYAERVGGLVLVGIGLKILIEHLFLYNLK